MKQILILSLLLSFSIITEPFISHLSIFKRKDPNEKIPEYVINTGEIHNFIPELNQAQYDVIKQIISDSDESSFFAFEYPGELETINKELQLIKENYDLYIQKLHVPNFLLNHAISEGKKAITVDFRHQLLADSIFASLLNDHFKSKIQNSSREICISVKEVGQLIINSIQQVQNDYDAFKERNNSLNQVEKKYMEYFDKCKEAFELDKSYAIDFLSIETDALDIFIR